jgi:flavorubredoxin
MISTTELSRRIYRVSFSDEEDLKDITFPGFSYNMFVIEATRPAIIQTMYRKTYRRLRTEVSNLLYPEALRYVVVPHHVGDSSGALNEWLSDNPEAEPVCSGLCSVLSLADYSVRPPKVVEDGEVIDLGSHRLRFLMTPQVDQWDSLMVFEEKSGILFSNDLFSTPGTEVSTAEDVSELALAVARESGYQPDDGPRLRKVLDKIEGLDVRAIAPMHGPTLTGNTKKLISRFRTNPLAMKAAAV